MVDNSDLEKFNSMFKEEVEEGDNTDRCIVLKNISHITTSEDITQHFKFCGFINSINVVHKNKMAFVEFKSKSAVEMAMKATRQLKGNKIGVFKKKFN